jgi:hypothetical protein
MRIPNGDACVCKSGRIDDDAGAGTRTLLNLINDISFMIGLKHFYSQSLFFPEFQKLCINYLKRHVTIYVRLSFPEHIQIWAMDDKNIARFFLIRHQNLLRYEFKEKRGKFRDEREESGIVY